MVTTNSSVKLVYGNKTFWIQSPRIWDSEGKTITASVTFEVINGQRYFVKHIPLGCVSNMTFPIYSDASIQWDTDETVFNSGATDYISVSALDSTHFVVAYSDCSNSKYGTARIGHFTGSSIVWDTDETVFNSGDTEYVSVSSLDSTHFVVAYSDYSNSEYGTARIGHFTGSSIVWDTKETRFNSRYTYHISVSSLDSTHFVVAYSDHSNSDYGTARIGHFTGSSIVWDTDETGFNSCIGSVSVSSLDSTHFVVAYSDCSNSEYGTARIGHFTGSSIAWDTDETVFNSRRTDTLSVSSLDSSHFVVAYLVSNGVVRVGHVSGSSVVWDTVGMVFHSGNAQDISVSSLDSTHFVVAYRDAGNSSEPGVVRVGYFDGSSVVWDTDESVFNPGSTWWISVSSLDGSHFVVAYRDDSNSKYGTARIGSVDFNPPSTTISPDGHSWTKSDVSFTLSCSDGGSGCGTTYYKIINNGDSCPAVGSYTSGTTGTVSCPAGSACQKRVCYYSVDNVGNVEAVHQSNVFYIDKRVLFKINFTYHINTTSDPGNSSDVVYTDVPVGSEDNGISFFVTPTGSNFSSIEFAQGENYTISFNYLVGDKFLIGLTKAPWSLIKEKNYEVSHNRYLIQPFAYPMFTSSTIYVILMRPDININSSSSVCNRGYKTIFIRNNGRSNGKYNIRFVCK